MLKKLTNEEFINRARKIHGKQYEYLSRYIRSSDKIRILCKKCNKEFLQTPNKHLQKRGCPYCAGNIKFTIGEFITAAIKVWGGKYDYSLIKQYNGNKDKLLINCKVHNCNFKQIAVNHLYGKEGCKRCLFEKRIATPEKFINIAKEKYGNRADYSKVKFYGWKNKVEIICNKHKMSFFQTPFRHCINFGCPLCAENVRIEKRKKIKNIAEFEQMARKKHGDRYIYVGLYINMRVPILMFCKEHGFFMQAPYKHLAGRGCNICGIEKNSISLEEFIARSTKIHNGFYNYELVGNHYNKTTGYVSIICPRHGVFFQRARFHLSGHGCPSCNASMGEKRIFKFLNKNKVKFERNKRFKRCKNPTTGYSLSYDFYINDKNLLIEYDGHFHYQDIKINSQIIKKEKTQYRDSIKTKYAENNNIKLIRIPYWEFDNIEKILSKELSLGEKNVN